MSERAALIWERIIAGVTISDEVNGGPWFEGTPCWLWQGATSGEGRGGGYGRISIDSCSSAVHRVVYTMIHGYVPAKRQIDHRCTNRLCCNPIHLEDMTHKQNQRKRRRT